MRRLEAHEVDDLFPSSGWHKSFDSNPEEPIGCVYINLERAKDDIIGIGDRNVPELGAFVCDRNEWSAFLSAAKNGQFDLQV